MGVVEVVLDDSCVGVEGLLVEDVDGIGECVEDEYGGGDGENISCEDDCDLGVNDGSLMEELW